MHKKYHNCLANQNKKIQPKKYKFIIIIIIIITSIIITKILKNKIIEITTCIKKEKRYHKKK
jgi:hypothetical protein